MMRRIAYASPVNPAASGISDYSEELLPYLGRYADLTLYLDDHLKPDNPHLARHLALRPLSRLERDHRRQPYDAILYHIGNSPVHAAIWRALQRVPGVVVLHDFVLHHFMLQYYATELRDIDRYRAEAQRRYGAEGERIANLMMHGRFTEAAFSLPFCEDVLAAADGLIAHSRFVAERARAVRPDLPSAVVPMGVPLPPAIPREQARAQLGIPATARVLASFGHINPFKRLQVVFRALRDLREHYADLRYILVGSVSPSYDVQAAIARANLGDIVTVTGYVDRERFEQYVAAADVCINLRHPTAGETSASLLRLLGAGRPTLVTATGSFAELPPDVAAQVDPDASEGDLVQAYCRLLLDYPDVAARMGQLARTFVAHDHTLEGAAAGIMRFLAQRYGWTDINPRRPPLWRVETAPSTSAAPPEIATAEPRPAETSHAATPLVRDAAHAVASLGLAEQDATLRAAAVAIAELSGATHQDQAQ
jgi:glycosyltransferase involved in cell wall biosynthesis